MKTKTRKTPLMMTTVFDLTCCPSAFVPESELSHNVEAHHGLVPKLGHHEWKNPASLKNHFSQYIAVMSGCAAGFLGFSLMRKESLKGITVFGGRLLGDWGLQSRHQMCLRPHKGEQITICDGGGETLAHKQNYDRWR
ncbi:hypothetical protein [Xylanibacter brevis]|uniref:hypothetical protein n=1 Tax=Xylanibacter brevis TaxID=83231 RepID=UPI0012DF44AF|nr:hypothetical protein [Xylanibacter brevis]